MFAPAGRDLSLCRHGDAQANALILRLNFVINLSYKSANDPKNNMYNMISKKSVNCDKTRDFLNKMTIHQSQFLTTMPILAPQSYLHNCEY